MKQIRAFVLALSIALNVLLLAGGAWYVHRVGAHEVAVTLGLREEYRPAYSVYAEERFAELPGERITIVGDSEVERGPWAEVLDQVVAVRGQSGELISEVTADVTTTVSDQARVVVVWAGTNDVLQGNSEVQIEADMDDLLTAIGDASPEARIVVLTLPPISWADQQTLNAANEAISSAAENHSGTEIVDVTAALQGMLTNDGVHLTAAGYEAIAPLLNNAIS